MIQFLTREIKERGQIPRDLGKLCTRAIYRESSENGHNWETEGKLASRNSAFPTSENNNLPVCTCSMHRIARWTGNKVVENGACVRRPFNLTWSYVLVPVPVNHTGNDQGGAGRERKGKDVSAAPSYPALIELLPPFYRARNKPCAYASSLVNKPRNKHSLALVSLVHVNRLKNFPRPSNICPTSERTVQKFPESLSKLKEAKASFERAITRLTSPLLPSQYL